MESVLYLREDLVAVLNKGTGKYLLIDMGRSEIIGSNISKNDLSKKINKYILDRSVSLQWRVCTWYTMLMGEENYSARSYEPFNMD